MDGKNGKPTSMYLIPAEQMLEIYEKIIRELISTFEFEEEAIESEPLPAPIG